MRPLHDVGAAPGVRSGSLWVTWQCCGMNKQTTRYHTVKKAALLCRNKEAELPLLAFDGLRQQML